MIILDSTDCIHARKYMETTRIGKGVDGKRVLSEKGMADTLDALKNFETIALEEKVDEIHAIATSAVRDAENREDFLSAVRNETSINVEMISGQEEARLGFQGVIGGLDLKEDEKILVIDIGGGSTELIVGSKKGIEFSISLDVGAVRLHDKFVKSDPVDLEDRESMADFTKGIIKSSVSKIEDFSISKVIGIGGTITTAASMALEMEEYDRKRIHNHFVPLETINDMNKRLWLMSVEERKSWKGLQPKRADVIPCGFLILQSLLLSLEKHGISISEYDNLEGLFFDIIGG
jgi:exopolyphosphatase/guanosine-5'-triphosphate,3'-diphosphate pyrophosphatase